MTTDDRLRAFAHDTLGPVVNRFLLRFDATLAAAAGPDTRVLMALRAGLRIEQLYRLWREARGTPSFTGRVLLRTSRMLAVKAAWGTQPKLALETLEREMGGAAREDAVRALLAPEIAAGRVEADLGPVPPGPLSAIADVDAPWAEAVRTHLGGQSERYGRYLDRLAAGADRLITVDTGWQGTPQMLLEAAFPGYDWEGIYFGVSGRREVLGHRPGPMHGLMADVAGDADAPEFALLLHRGLIDSLFAPGIPSIETLAEADLDEPPSVETLVAQETPGPRDAAFRAVGDYVRAHAADPVARVMADHRAAMARLARTLIHPAPEDVALLAGSSDNGSSRGGPAVFPPEDRFGGDSADRRTADAAWPTGQAALEYPETARRHQAALAQALRPRASGTEAGPAHVAVITRTRGTPALLRRVAASVAAQTHDDYTWVVVNDGGEPGPVEAIVAASRVDPRRVVVCHVDGGAGPAAALNAGIAAVASDLIAVHDDGDSWAPGFLETSVAFLQRWSGLYSGVISGTATVEEEVQGARIREVSRKDDPGVPAVELTAMAAGNLFDPIAFVFRRDAHDVVGGFDPALPVLGDWDFNLRFLMQHDIGVIPEVLAHRHRRGDVRAEADPAVWTAILRNRMLRRAAADPGQGALAALIAATGQRAGPIPTPPVESVAVKGAVTDDGFRAAAWMLRHLAAAEGSAGTVRAAVKGLALSGTANAAGMQALAAELVALKARLSGPAGAEVGAGAAEGQGVSVRWSQGMFRDNWVAQEAELTLDGAAEVELTLFLPRRDDGKGKGLRVFEGDELLSETALVRGKPNRIRLAPRGPGGAHRLRLVAEYAEAGKEGDVRLLGFQCLDTKVIRSGQGG